MHQLTPGVLRVARRVAVPLLAFLALAAWGLSAPVGATPDEDYHLSSIWCGQGLEAGSCEEGPVPDERSVPQALLFAQDCYVFELQTSAACQAFWLSAEEYDPLFPTDRGNISGDYPPVFYFAMNVLVGDDLSRSVVAMRMANAGLFVGLMTLTFWVLPRARRTMFLLGTVVALVPLGMFLLPSVNPSSWAIFTTGLVFSAVVGFYETSGRRRIALGALAGVGTLLGAGARADAAVYLALAIVLATLLALPWRRSSRWRSRVGVLAYPALLCLGCAASWLSSGQSGAASQDGRGPSPHSYDLVQQVASNLLNAPGLWAGAFGYWDLGWLDTPLPSVVWVANLVVFGSVVFIGLRQAPVRKVIALVAVLGAAWFIPIWVLLQTDDLVGYGVQPRYLLPLLVLLAQVALFRIGPSGGGLDRPQVFLVATALTVTNLVSLHVNIRRYVTGADVLQFDLTEGREWWWGIPVSPMTLWALGSVAFGLALFSCIGIFRTDEDERPVEHPVEHPVVVAGERADAAGAPSSEVPAPRDPVLSGR